MTYLEGRWALQLIAEEGIGRALVRESDAEEAAMAAARNALGG